MSLFEAVVLALVQALTEFLPVSSTAHLYLFPWLFGWGDPGITFTIAVHFGTLFAVLLYFFKTWLRLLLCGFGVHYPRTAPVEDVRQQRRIFWFLVLGTIPAALAGFFLEHHVETTFRDPRLMGWMLIVVAGLMWLGERRAAAGRQINELTLLDSVLIGSAQAIALIPGVSRSGITITSGLFAGMSREAAARFTFLLSTPIIAGASVIKFMEIRHSLSSVDTNTLALATLVSAVAGYLVIAVFMRYLQTRTLKIFIVYRLLFGILILLLLHFGAGLAR